MQAHRPPSSLAGVTGRLTRLLNCSTAGAPINPSIKKDEAKVVDTVEVSQQEKPMVRRLEGQECSIYRVPACQARLGKR